MDDDIDEMTRTTPSFVPEITYGETIYSWAAHYHRLSGNSLAKESSLQLFGNRRAGLRHDFPSHLDRLSQRTSGCLGDSASLTLEKTVLGYIAPFRDRALIDQVQQLMGRSSVAKVKFLLGLPSSRVGGFFPLKACPSCIKDDLRTFSISRWHVEHQWPSTWVCRRHGKVLWAVRREYQAKDLRRWLLPEDVSDREKLMIEVSSSMKSKLLKLAEFGAYAAQKESGYFDEILLRYTYLRRAKVLGWLNTDGSLRLALVRGNFERHFEGLGVIPGFELVNEVGAAHGGMLGLLMRRYKRRRHPLKHILLSSFLFKSPSELDTLYSAVRKEFEVGGIESLQTSIRWEWIERLRHLVEDDAMSVCKAASVIGIPMNVAVRAAKQCQIKYQHRPHVEDTTLGDAIREMLIEGLSREQILERSGIKRGLLKDLMAKSPGLRAAWRKMDFERRRTEYRSRFLRLLSQCKGLSLKKIRMIPGNGVSWLYRKDREWYKERLPKANGL